MIIKMPLMKEARRVLARAFSTTNYLRSSPMVGQALADDEFLPEFEEKEMKHHQKLDSSISMTKKPDSMLRHGEELGGVVYKYDLPVVNQAIVFRSQQLAVREEAKPTAVESLLAALAVDKDTSYESFVIKMHQEYNNEVDMYGDVRRAGEAQLKVLEFGVPIPWEVINDAPTMKTIRSLARFNPDMPGSIEQVHPNKFLPSKPSCTDPCRPAARRGVPPHARDPDQRARPGRAPAQGRRGQPQRLLRRDQKGHHLLLR